MEKTRREITAPYYSGIMGTQLSKRSIWCTAEADAWSRNFDYANYRRIQADIHAAPLCEAAYAKLCEALNLQHHQDVNSGEGAAGDPLS